MAAIQHLLGAQVALKELLLVIGQAQTVEAVDLDLFCHGIALCSTVEGAEAVLRQIPGGGAVG